MSGRRRPRALALAAVVSVTALAACTPGGPMTASPSPEPSGPVSLPTAASPTTAVSPASPATPASPSTGRPTFRTMPPLSPAPSGAPTSVSDARLQAIKADLGNRGVDAASAKVVSAESVTWNDSSLGCPTPGGMYSQALVEGMRVIVETGGRQYDYRFGSGDSATLCEPR